MRTIGKATVSALMVIASLTLASCSGGTYTSPGPVVAQGNNNDILNDN
jgi:hypothetical protein